MTGAQRPLRVERRDDHQRLVHALPRDDGADDSAAGRERVHEDVRSRRHALAITSNRISSSPPRIRPRRAASVAIASSAAELQRTAGGVFAEVAFRRHDGGACSPKSVCDRALIRADPRASAEFAERRSRRCLRRRSPASSIAARIAVDHAPASVAPVGDRRRGVARDAETGELAVRLAASRVRRRTSRCLRRSEPLRRGRMAATLVAIASCASAPMRSRTLKNISFTSSTPPISAAATAPFDDLRRRVHRRGERRRLALRHGDVEAAQVPLDGDVAARRVRDRLREQLRRRERGAFLHVLLHVVDGGLHGTERRADGDAGRSRRASPPQSSMASFAAATRVPRQRVHPPHLHRRDEVLRLEVANQRGLVRAEAGRCRSDRRRDRGAPLASRCAKCVDADRAGRNDTDAGDRDRGSFGRAS